MDGLSASLIMISLVAPGGRKSCVICSEMTVLWLVLICMFVVVL